MRVCVTGARGYIGAVVLPELAAKGHVVFGIDAGWFEACDFLPPPPFPWKQCDIRDLSARDLEGFDAVVHFAALSNDPLGNRDERLTWQINCEASARLAQAARQAGVRRFVFASSCSVYGALPADALATEATPPQPLTAYARAKASAEVDILSLECAEFFPTVLRFATVYGFSPRLRLDLAANQFVAWALARREIVLHSDGLAWRPLVHVRDVALAVATVLEAAEPLVRGQVFNVGSADSNVQVRDLADTVAGLCPGTRVVRAARTADRRTYRVSFDRWAEAFPGALARVHLEQGLRELIAHFERRAVSPTEIESGRFERLAELERLEQRGQLTRDLRWVGR